MIEVSCTSILSLILYALNTHPIFIVIMIENEKFYKSAKMLGLNKKEIDDILNDTSAIAEQTSFSSGPFQYPGGRYGTVSIEVF
ncbi:unnamed protein product [marine sediment metagenome]|uniref:Uncharacterized protein n=1 Tax=marine sediment metagenome TaxID=412755 RepID=X1CKP2_9ZZZZ